MLKFSIQCTRLESNYSSFTGMSSDCSRNEGKKGKEGMKLNLPTKLVEKN
jgi:hypothetical protein